VKRQARPTLESAVAPVEHEEPSPGLYGNAFLLLQFREELEHGFGEPVDGVDVVSTPSPFAEPGRLGLPAGASLEVVAHEFAHLVQFRRYGPGAGDSVGQPAEEEAQQAAAQVASGGRAVIRTAPEGRRGRLEGDVNAPPSEGPLTGQRVGSWGAFLNLGLFARLRWPVTFEDEGEAVAFSRTRGDPAFVTREEEHYRVYQLDAEDSWADFFFELDGAGTAISCGTAGEVDLQTEPFVLAVALRDGLVVRHGDTPDTWMRHAEPDADSSVASLEAVHGESLEGTTDEDSFLAAFRVALLDEAFSVLDLSEDRTYETRGRLQDAHGSLPEADQQTLAEVLPQLVEVEDELSSAEFARDALRASMDPEAAVPVDTSGLDAEIYSLREERELLWTRYPMLRRVDAEDFAALSEAEQSAQLVADCTEVLDNIGRARDALRDGSLDPFDLVPVVRATQARLAIGDEDPRMEWVRAREHEMSSRELVQLALAAVAIGLSFGAALTTGGVSAAMAVGALSVSVPDAVWTTEDYSAHASAADTDVDPSASVRPADLSWEQFSVVTAWVGLGLDALDAIALFRVFDEGFDLAAELGHYAERARTTVQALLDAATYTSRRSTAPLRAALLAALDPGVAAHYTDENLQIVVHSPGEFTRRFGGAGQAVTEVGEEVVVVHVRDSSRIEEAIRFEAPHLAQATDPALRAAMESLSPRNLEDWASMGARDRLELWGTQLDLEIDAAERTLARTDLGPDDLERQLRTAEGLRRRRAEVDRALQAASAGGDEERLLESLPDWLDLDETPRLYHLETEMAGELGATAEALPIPSGGMSVEARRAATGGRGVPRDEVLAHPERYYYDPVSGSYRPRPTGATSSLPPMSPLPEERIASIASELDPMAVMGTFSEAEREVIRRLPAEAWQRVVAYAGRGTRRISLDSLRGVLQEEVMRVMPEFGALSARAETAATALRDAHSGHVFDSVRFTAEVTAGAPSAVGASVGEITDGIHYVISTDAEGARHLWVIDVLESKSPSNFEDLATDGSDMLGQISRDFERMRLGEDGVADAADGLTVAGEFFPVDQLHVDRSTTRWIGLAPSSPAVSEEAVGSVVERVREGGFAFEAWRCPVSVEALAALAASVRDAVRAVE
jgi:hypothetical protein